MKIDSLSIAQRFAKAGQSYHAHAIVQKQIAQQLAEYMQQYLSEYCPRYISGRYLEIGCGSGHLSQILLQQNSYFQPTTYYCNDLYSEVQQHFAVDTRLHWLIGNIERLVLPGQLDLIVSSSALQWMQDIDALLEKMHAALKPHAFLCFSSFGADNLNQIKRLTGQGLDYLSLEQWQVKLQQHGFEVILLRDQVETLYFEHPLDVLKHLKATGVTATAQQYRWSKQSLQQFYQDYQALSSKDMHQQLQYPLSYHPLYCIARRIA